VTHRAGPVAWLLALALIALLAPPARATPAEDLASAREAFRRSAFKDAVPLLSYLLYPTPRLAQTDDLVEAHVLLGVCQFETGETTVATREFEEALFLQPDLTIDTTLFSEAAVHFFTETRAAMQERLKRDAERRAIAEEKERLRRYRESLVVYEVRPYYVNFIPFGAGQFQNRQRSKGLWFATTQATTGALSAGIWLYLVGTYGFNGRVKPTSANFVLRLQQVEIGAGGVCLGLMAWGIVDALVHYRPRALVGGDDSLLPPDLRRGKGPTSSFSISPALLPDGGGVVLTWER
jgi:tetratricopeptide (TPR) repeat protein